MAWFGVLPLLICFYLLAGPWIVLFVYGLIPGVSADDPLGHVLDSFIYPAFKFAEVNEFYGSYFRYALRGVGG